MRPSQKRLEESTSQGSVSASAEMKPILCSRFLRSIRRTPIDCIVQVGIGRGEELPTLRSMFPRADLFGFEPLLVFYKFWRKTGYPGRLLKYAVTSRTGTAVLYRAGKLEASSLYPRRHETRPALVRTISLDDAVHRFWIKGRCILLWMDCEGAEIEVLNGAQHFLKNVAYATAEFPANRISYASSKFRSSVPTAEALLARFSEAGFVHINTIQSDGLFQNTAFVLPPPMPPVNCQLVEFQPALRSVVAGTESWRYYVCRRQDCATIIGPTPYPAEKVVCECKSQLGMLQEFVTKQGSKDEQGSAFF